ncbi:MAG: hypothetical protein K2X99_05605 [Gemmatimonadaceae bacterium]|nr:hypothetical protein [Gemmatimonadaceae bacterium]
MANTCERTLLPRRYRGPLLGAICLAACEQVVPRDARSSAAPAVATVDSGFAAVPDSVWVVVSGPTLIGFSPEVSNAQLEADEGLASVLDDFAYHIGTAADSLQAAGFKWHFRGGDTLWLRTMRGPSRFVRTADSADVGYLFADTLGRQAVIYGVRTHLDLVAYAREFTRTGAVVTR